MAEEDKSTEQEAANAEAEEEQDEKSDKKKKETRKSQLVALYLSGMHDIEDLSMVTGARPSYIGNVLREAGLEDGYFDLYTSSKHPMNVYSKFFTDKLGFKDAQAAQDSVDHIDKMYGQFELGRDRAGQHHTMMMALTMANRAQWTGKHDEATLFRDWLINRLADFNEESHAIVHGDDHEEE
jgi:hypothetical protein